jgi:hypothetical protein
VLLSIAFRKKVFHFRESFKKGDLCGKKQDYGLEKTTIRLKNT